MRKELNLEPGDPPEIKGAGKQIFLRPWNIAPTKEHGVWVFLSREPLPASATDQGVEQIREERDAANLAGSE